MSITTRGGDKGTSSMFDGTRLPKDDIHFETVGTGDELVSNLGELKHVAHGFVPLIEVIQKKIFTINAHCVAPAERERYTVKQPDLDWLDRQAEKLEGEVGRLKGFVIPAATPAAAKADVCRTVARRYERRLISLSKCDSIAPVILQYVNRMSDVLYLVARTLEKREGKRP